MEDWGAAYNTTTSQFGLHPCNNTGRVANTNSSAAQYLVRRQDRVFGDDVRDCCTDDTSISGLQAARNVTFATFEVKVDALVALTINQTDLRATFNESASYASAIAFRWLVRSLTKTLTARAWGAWGGRGGREYRSAGALFARKQPISTAALQIAHRRLAT